MIVIRKMKYMLVTLLLWAAVPGVSASATSQPIQQEKIKSTKKTAATKPVENDAKRVAEQKEKLRARKDAAPARKEAVATPAKKETAAPAKPVAKVKVEGEDMKNVIYDGIDVSSYQKDIDWRATAEDKNIKFVYVKATEGATYRSRHYEQNMENARQYGIRVGSYHFLRTTVPIIRQFENFISVAKKEDQDLVPLIDVEVKDRWTPQQVADSVEYFAKLLEDYYGCRPMIYTGAAFYNSYLGGRIGNYPLFIARYSKHPPQLRGGVKWTLWQFSERGRIAGIDHYVDLCRFNTGCGLKDIMVKGRKAPARRKTADVPPPKKTVREEKSVPEKKVKPIDERVQKQREKLRDLKDKEAEKERKAAEKKHKQEKADAATRQKAAEEQKAKERREREKRQKQEREAAEKQRKQEKADSVKRASQMKKEAELKKKAAEKKQKEQEAQKKAAEQKKKAAELKKKQSSNQKVRNQGKRINGSSADND